MDDYIKSEHMQNKATRKSNENEIKLKLKKKK